MLNSFQWNLGTQKFTDEKNSQGTEVIQSIYWLSHC